MDVRTVCLGILTRGDATGYEIRKIFESGGFRHFAGASFGSIYPALGRLTEEGLVRVREEPQEKRPDRKVYSIAPLGLAAFAEALMKPLPEDRRRSDFAFAIMFSEALPARRVSALLDDYILQTERRMAQLTRKASEKLLPGERFAIDLGRTIYAATLQFLRARRGDIEGKALQAAE